MNPDLIMEYACSVSVFLIGTGMGLMALGLGLYVLANVLMDVYARFKKMRVSLGVSPT